MVKVVSVNIQFKVTAKFKTLSDLVIVNKNSKISHENYLLNHASCYDVRTVVPVHSSSICFYAIYVNLEEIKLSCMQHTHFTCIGDLQAIP